MPLALIRSCLCLSREFAFYEQQLFVLLSHRECHWSLTKGLKVSEHRRGAAAILSESSVASRFTIKHGMSKVIDQDLQVSDLEWRRVLVMFSNGKSVKRLRWAAAASRRSIWEHYCYHYWPKKLKCLNLRVMYAFHEHYSIYYQAWSSSDRWPKKHKCLTLSHEHYSLSSSCKLQVCLRVIYRLTFKHGVRLIVDQRNASIWLWAMSIIHWAAAAIC